MTVVLAIAVLLLAAALTLATRRLLAARDAEAAARAEAAAARAEAAAARAELERDRSHHAELRAELERATDEKVALLSGNREAFKQEMQAIAGEVMKTTSAQVAAFAEQARKADHERSSGEMRARAAEIKQVVAPIAEHLKKVQSQVETLERDRKETHGTIRQLFETVTAEVGRLRLETGTLVSALKRPQVRGSWGEIQLRNVARIAGMTEHVDFHDQRTLDAGDDGKLRPDMTVHLPTGRDVVVDSKVPLDAYLASLEARDDDAREVELDRHAAQLRTHLDRLASKSYHAALERSAEFVVCFIPNEGCYAAALDRDPSLWEHGASRGVLLATPTTLLALLHATLYGWRQAEVEESAQEIVKAGQELHKRSARFLESFGRLGRQLDSATGAYNEAVGSLEGRVLPQLRRFEQFHAGSERELTQPKAIDAAPRAIVAAELVEGEAAAGADLPDGEPVISRLRG
jgi:DNA recombination protein RmuC